MHVRDLMMFAWVAVAFTACAPQVGEQQAPLGVNPQDGDATSGYLRDPSRWGAQLTTEIAKTRKFRSFLVRIPATE